MRKLHLDPDALEIQSFSTEAVDRFRGTVQGMDSATVDQDTCNTCPSDVDTCVSCQGTCFNTCASCPLSCNPANCPSSDGRC